MRRILSVPIFCLLFACNDGDIQIETVDFDSITTIDNCEEILISQKNILFKINTDEALILELPNNVLKNEATVEIIESDISASGPSIITYRIFSENVTRNYFCDEIPPTTPTVVENIEAKSGKVLITTVQSDTDNLAYEHTIELKDIVLENTKGEQIIDTRVNSFGIITTTAEN